ncbi:hypothetical protein MTR_8g064660 [Medicago truncatula]|uniref:Uncharacterized protein n=1 Tax=Medicago truncatula TaxID=3880 RepID=A0A072TS49_MEDTR|nr:hypothetical protein MTR_8g064660 [Medicago truncatula]
MLFSLSSANPIKRKQYTPCKNIVLYFHDIIYNGMNAANATSSIVELHKFLMTLSHWTLTFIQNQLEKHKAFTFMIPKTHTLLDTKGGPKIWQVYSRRGKKAKVLNHLPEDQKSAVESSAFSTMYANPYDAIGKVFGPERSGRVRELNSTRGFQTF